MKINFILSFILVSQFCFAQNWETLGYGLSWNTTCMYEDTTSDQLFIGGSFGLADSQAVRFIATYSDNWGSLGVGFNACSWGSGSGNPWAITRFNSHIYVGGNFDCAGGVNNTNAFARWNGSAWDSVPGGMISSSGGVVKDLLVYNNELYVCGTFNMIGSLAANGIVKWDGTTWSVVGDNYNFLNQGLLSKMMFYHGNLYVAGSFLDPQSNVCRLAKWNGNNWEFLTSIGNSGLATWDLEVYNDELYVSGGFYFGGGNPGMGIIRWNDTVWRDVGGSVQFGTFNSDPVVKEMCVHDGKLYCVGNFEKIGGVVAMGLASWDGNQWCGYDTHFDYSGPNDFIGAMNIAFFRDTMYVGGGFQFMDTMQVNYIARWVGGNFVDTCGTAVGVFENTTGMNQVLVYPNPASEIITFQFSDTPQSRSIIICDALGRQIWRKETNENTVEYFIDGTAPGLYYYRIEDQSAVTFTGKLVIE